MSAQDGTTSCSIPSIKPLNFKYLVKIQSQANRTLSCEIHSDTPLKKEPVWRRDFPTYLPKNHNVENASCSYSANETCIRSSLTLITVVRDEYDGNYTVTAENDCGNATVRAFINVMGE